MALAVADLRQLFRNLQQFRSCFEYDGVDLIVGPDGDEWCLWDLEYLYRVGLPMLPTRQHQAIELCLVRNMKESDAATAMGVSATNPVAMYATEGLKKLIVMIQAGALPMFRAESRMEAYG